MQITDFKERGLNKDLVAATVYVEQESQKGMVIGRKGSALKTLGIAARADIESFLGESRCSRFGGERTVHLLGMHLSNEMCLKCWICTHGSRSRQGS